MIMRKILTIGRYFPVHAGQIAGIAVSKAQALYPDEVSMQF